VQRRDHYVKGEMQPQHALATHHADFQAGVVIDPSDQRNETVDRKVDMPCRRPSLI